MKWVNCLLRILFWTKFGYKIGYSLKSTTSFKKINITIYFENLSIGLHVLYTLNIYIKFCANYMLFTI